jgi:hypothetical protein
MELAGDGYQSSPGIKPADIQELLDHGARVVALSRGMKECLQVPPETLDFLKERQIAGASPADGRRRAAL